MAVVCEWIRLVALCDEGLPSRCGQSGMQMGWEGSVRVVGECEGDIAKWATEAWMGYGGRGDGVCKVYALCDER